jgi:hypothetical protein
MIRKVLLTILTVLLALQELSQRKVLLFVLNVLLVRNMMQEIVKNVQQERLEMLECVLNVLKENTLILQVNLLVKNVL